MVDKVLNTKINVLAKWISKDFSTFLPYLPYTQTLGKQNTSNIFNIFNQN